MAEFVQPVNKLTCSRSTSGICFFVLQIVHRLPLPHFASPLRTSSKLVCILYTISSNLAVNSSSNSHYLPAHLVHRTDCSSVLSITQLHRDTGINAIQLHTIVTTVVGPGLLVVLPQDDAGVLRMQHPPSLQANPYIF